MKSVTTNDDAPVVGGILEQRTIGDSETNLSAAATRDVAAARAFLNVLAEGEQVTFQTFEDTPQKRPELAEIVHGDPDDGPLMQRLELLNHHGAGVFWTVNRTDGQGRRATNVTAVRALFVDLDGAPIGPVEQCAAEPHAVVESSPGRFHAYWLVSDCPLDKFRAAQASLAARFDGDASVIDLPRVMRLPGFIHNKGDPFVTTTRTLNVHAPYALADLAQRLGLNLSEQLKRAAGSHAISGAAIAPGGRHAHIERVFGSLNSAGLGVDAIEAALQAENATRCSPPLDSDDVSKTVRAMARRYSDQRGSNTRHQPTAEELDQQATEVRGWIASSALPMAQRLDALESIESPEWLSAMREAVGVIDRARGAAEAELPPLTRLSPEDLAQDPPPVIWHWRGLMPAGEVTLMPADGGVGKSYIALMLAASIATGAPLFGLATRPGKVLYYSGEDPACRVHRRIRSIADQAGLRLDEGLLADNLHLIDAVSDDKAKGPELYAEQREGHGPTPMYSRLLSYVRRHAIDVVIIDNASDAYDGNENVRSPVRGFVRSLAKLVRNNDGAVLLLAHVNKGTAQGARSGQEYSGSTAWSNSARSRIFVEAFGENRKTGYKCLRLSNQKHNDGVGAEPIELEWLPHEPLPKLLVPVQPAVAAIQRTNDMRAVLKLIYEYTERGEFVSAATTSRTHAGKLLRREPAFPKLTDPELFDLLRRAERDGLLRRETYKGGDRHARERWAVTAEGLAP